MFRNERSLYRATCNRCKKAIFSTYAPESPYTVYCKECWFSDTWDPLEYGVAYDWNKPFFEQFDALKIRVPRIATMHVKMNTNSEYANFLGESKNVYLAYSILRSENIMYSRVVDDSRDCIDCSDLQHGELCYETIQSDNMNRARYVYSCTNCINSSFLFDCVNCQNCFMSSNLRSKQYVFRNRQLSKEAYKAELEKINRDSYRVTQTLLEEYRHMMRVALHKYADMLKSVNCIGDNILDSKNVRYSFDIYNTEDCKYSDRLVGPKDSYDLYGAAAGELHYEGMAVTYGGHATKFCLIGDDMRDSAYTDYCLHSSNLFGCIGLKKKKYCILNKEYTQSEYEALVPKIIAHMNSVPYTDPGGRVYRYGEFFPPYQYAYNETLAHEDVPLTKQEVLARGYQWRDPDHRELKIKRLAETLPDDIREVDDAITNEILGCEHGAKCNEQCTTAFKITPQELQFYKQMQIPLPRLCPNCRHYARLKIRNPHVLWRRTCRCAGTVSESGTWKNTAAHFHGAAHCPNTFETTYAPDRSEIVYCEQCYQQEIS